MGEIHRFVPVRPIAALAVLLLAVALLLAAPAASAAQEDEEAHAVLVDADGTAIGVVNFIDLGVMGIDGTFVIAEIDGLPAGGGFHGFHIHAVGACDPTDGFASAGGHYNPDGAAHPGHAGDMPALLALEDGTATAAFFTDRFTVAELLGAEDGAAVIVHARPDNHANIPDRYVSQDENEGGPDSETLSHGDAGPRIACGAVAAGEGPFEDEPTLGRGAVAFVEGPDGLGGEVGFRDVGGGRTLVIAEVGGLPGSGFHGFHVHGVGECDPDDGFASAGGHFNPAGDPHGDHAGDLPVLLALADGFGLGVFVTDRFAVGDLLDAEDGAAVIVHANPDNFGNVPERYVSQTEDPDYVSGPDNATLSHGDAGARIGCGVVEETVDVERHAGADRIETAIAVSRALYPTDGSANTVVVTRADDFADALAGTPLAVDAGGPVLLTAVAQLDGRTRAEIDRVLGGSGVVHVLGGEAAVHPDVAAELEDAGYTVVRLAGEDRFATAVEVAGALGNPDAVLIARAFEFPDAVVAGAAAAQVGGAVLLTTDEEPHATTTGYLDANDPDEVYALGGPAARAYPDAIPVFGEHRWETARLVAEAFFDEPFAVGVARSDAFPDALTGGVLTGVRGAPMLLTQPTALHPDAEAYLCANAEGLWIVAAFGGPQAIAGEVLAAIADRALGEGCPS